MSDVRDVGISTDAVDSRPSTSGTHVLRVNHLEKSVCITQLTFNSIIVHCGAAHMNWFRIAAWE